MSYVYVFDLGDMVKVGYTADIKARKHQIRSETKRKVINSFSVPAEKNVEMLAHKELEPFRIQGEYYSCPYPKACLAVRAAVRKGMRQLNGEIVGTVRFTMVLPQDLVRELDYLKTIHKRSRIKEIEWACKQYIKDFESKNGEIEKEAGE